MSKKRTKPVVTLQLLPQEVRHLIDYLGWHEAGRWDEETDGWTYPQHIGRKLYRALNTKGKKRR